MKNKLTIFILFAVVVASFSCAKPTHPQTGPLTYPIEGLWIGTFKYDQGVSPNQNPQYFSFVIKPEGELIVESKDDGIKYFATGTWTLTNSTLQCSYVYSTSVLAVPLSQMATATFQNSGKLTTGKWHNQSNVNEKGTFTLNRIN